jgi:lichenysin synthetase C
MVDSYRKTGLSDLQGRSVEQDVDTLLQANQHNPYLQLESVRQGFAGKLTAYYTYYVELINTGKVQSPIDFIQSESAVPLPNWMSSWKEATASHYEEFQGYGKHDELLQGHSAPANVGLIRRILWQAGSNDEVSDQQPSPVAFTG